MTIDNFSKTTDGKYQTDVIILDLLKAFDTVPHRRLLQKPERCSLDLGIAASTGLLNGSTRAHMLWSSMESNHEQ